ncbi:MAG TPA: 30S ribosomal protein S16 [bacterium]|nr:30S ribosomal protein S16 [bacterium]HPV65458.1 30S ribosomal protein S16 [bacterium]
MLTIKMAKVGKTNKKVFRIVVSEKARDPYGRALEILGSYNPYSKKLDVKADRVKHWISKGSQMTPSINNLFIDNKVIDGGKIKNSKPGTPNKRKLEKAEKIKEKELAAAQAAEEAKKAAEEAKNNPVEQTETPSEEVKAE